jgi:hypothetical protein
MVLIKKKTISKLLLLILIGFSLACTGSDKQSATGTGFESGATLEKTISKNVIALSTILQIDTTGNTISESSSDAFIFNSGNVSHLFIHGISIGDLSIPKANAVVQLNNSDTLLSKSFFPTNNINYVSNENSYFEVEKGDRIRLIFKDFTATSASNTQQSIEIKCDVIYQY